MLGFSANTDALVNNNLTTGTLTVGDIQNYSTYSATGVNIGGGYTSENFSLVKSDGSRATSLDPNQPNGSVPGLAPGYSNESGKVTSLTQSGISGGAITITDYLKQQTLTGQTTEQTVVNLNRTITTGDGANSLAKTWDAEQLRNEVAANAQIIATFTQQANLAVNNIEKDAEKAKADAKQAYVNSLSAKDQASFAKFSQAEQDTVLLAKSADYQDAYATAQNWGVGGDYSRAANAVVLALTGQTPAGMVANGLAPYAAELIGQAFDPNHDDTPNQALDLLSHALLGAILAKANGLNAVGGGTTAAASGELAIQYLTEQLYGVTNPSQLSENQKQTLVALSQAVGLIAGGVVGGSAGDAATGINIAKNAVENNWLSQAEVNQADAERAACALTSANEQACQDDITRRMDALNKARKVELTNYLNDIIQQLAAQQDSLPDDQKLNHAQYIATTNLLLTQYWEAYGLSPDDDVYGGYEPAGEAGYFLRSMAGSVVNGIEDAVKFFDRPAVMVGVDIMMDVKNLFTNAVDDVTGYVNAPLPGLYLQSGIENTLAMTTEEMAGLVASGAVVVATEGVLRVASSPGVVVGAESAGSQFVYDASVNRFRSVETGQFVAARNLPWPDNAGFASSSMQTIPEGTILDRFGETSGRFLGEPGTSASARGMAPGTESMSYSQYQVLKPFDARVGPAAPVPAFGAQGGATQYLPGQTVQQLLDSGFLVKVK